MTKAESKVINELIRVWDSLNGNKYYSSATIEAWLKELSVEISKVRSIKDNYEEI